MEKLQIQAARIVTGTNAYASKFLLYHETGWDKLSERRQKHRLILLYKLLNGLAPMHLDNILQTYTNTRSRYNFRNTDMHLIYTRTEAFRLSFFPCSFRLWNELDESAKSANTLASFKSQLFKNKTKKNDYHEYGCRKMNTILASIRMHCSKLSDDLSSNNITDINTCNCGNIETAFHFFFECPLYTVHRNQLLLNTAFVPSLTLNIILNGDKNVSTRDNIRLHEAVSNFISNTNRF